MICSDPIIYGRHNVENTILVLFSQVWDLIPIKFLKFGFFCSTQILLKKNQIFWIILYLHK